MQIVLLERVEHLGNLGDVVDVKPGYARNYLLPRAKALRATKTNLAQFEQRKAELKAAGDAKRAEAEKLAKTLDGKSIVMIRQASEGGQLYGSVSSRDVADALIEGKNEVSRNQVRLLVPIKTLGIFSVPVVLHPDVTIAITVNIARSQADAATQAKTGKAVISAEEEEKAANAANAEAAFQTPAPEEAEEENAA